MKSPTVSTVIFWFLLILAFCFVPRAEAQVPSELKHSFLSPSTEPQAGAEQGYCVAVDGNVAVVGAPSDNTGGYSVGVVKVYDAATGRLLHILAQPYRTGSAKFGMRVAISGNSVVVGSGPIGGGEVYVYDLASAAVTKPTLVLKNPSSSTNSGFGSSVAISGTRIIVGASNESTGASYAGSAYVYDLTSATPTVPVATLNNPSPETFDEFGYSVAISGTRVVVGARSDNTGARMAGSAYVYELAGATPSIPLATLNNPNPTSQDYFGTSVAIEGTRVVVSAPEKDMGNSTNSGILYVYESASADPAVPVKTLASPTPRSYGRFGLSVALSSGILAVGAFDISGTAGNAYVFDLSSQSSAVPIATIKNPSPVLNDYFGSSVAVSSKWVVIGAYGDGTIAPTAGSAYSYDLGASSFATPVAILNSPSPSAGDYFGFAVSLSGRWMAVGAPYDAGTGKVYVYDLTLPNPLIPQLVLGSPTGEQGARFGASVVIDGTKVAVGAPWDDAAGFESGSVYIYDLEGVKPAEPLMRLSNPSPSSGLNFGVSIAMSGTRVLVGAPSDNRAARASGVAYVYDLTSKTAQIPLYTLENPTPAQDDSFGKALAIYGNRLVVGAPQDDTGASNAGSVYVYDLSGPTPALPEKTINNPFPAVGDLFGSSTAIQGTRIVVGATGSKGGSVHIFNITGATPATPVLTLKHSNPTLSFRFGRAVAVSGSRVVIGAEGGVGTALSRGSAYIFDLSQPVPTEPVAVFDNPNPYVYPDDTEFGYVVAIDGTNLAIGAHLGDTPIADKGAVYLYAPAADADNDGLLDSWEIEHFGTTIGHGAHDDFDEDGHEELIELAFGGDPKVSDSPAALTPVVEDGFLTVTISKQPGVIYTVQSADSPSGSAFSAATTTVLVNNSATLKVRDNFTATATRQRFIRVVVTAAP